MKRIVQLSMLSLALIISNSGCSKKKNTTATQHSSTETNTTNETNTSSPYWVMGYYVMYERDLMSPEEIDWNGLTHIVVGRVLANSDGTLNTNFDYDPTNGPILAKDIAIRAHNAGKKAILMLGGSDNGVQIHDAVANHRTQFIANLVSAMNTYGYDGLDLDWEDHIDLNLFYTFRQRVATSCT